MTIWDHLLELSRDWPIVRFFLLMVAFTIAMTVLELAKFICLRIWYWNGEDDDY